MSSSTTTKHPHTARDNRIVDLSRRLPNGRAMLGGVLVAVAAIALFAATNAGSSEPTTSYVVTSRTVKAGQVIAKADVSLIALDLPESVARNALDHPRLAVGTIALDGIPAGSVLHRAQTSAGSRTHGKPLLSFSISADRAAAGDLTAGDRIDVLVTWDHTTDGDTEVVARNLPVIDVTKPGRSALGDDAKLTVSVNVASGTDLVPLTRAIRAGQLTLVRTTGTAR